MQRLYNFVFDTGIYTIISFVLFACRKLTAANKRF